MAPFSLAALDLRVESRNGLTHAGLRAEAGGEWSTEAGWRRRLGAEAEVERVVLAVQDRPLSIFVSGDYEPSDESLSGLVGLRLAPVVRIPRAQRPLSTGNFNSLAVPGPGRARVGHTPGAPKPDHKTIRRCL